MHERVLSGNQTGSEGNCSILSVTSSVQLRVNLMLSQIVAVLPNPVQTPDRDEAMRQGMSLLMMLSLLGVLVVSMLAILMVMRSSRRKRSKHPQGPTDLSVDAWAEAGKRMDSGITEFDEEL
jgi:hypothetical protein